MPPLPTDHWSIRSISLWIIHFRLLTVNTTAVVVIVDIEINNIMTTLYSTGFVKKQLADEKHKKINQKYLLSGESIEGVFSACIKRRYRQTVSGSRVNTEKRLLVDCNARVCVSTMSMRVQYNKIFKIIWRRGNDDAFTMTTEGPIYTRSTRNPRIHGFAFYRSFYEHINNNYILYGYQIVLDTFADVQSDNLHVHFHLVVYAINATSAYNGGCHTHFGIETNEVPAKTECDNSWLLRRRDWFLNLYYL